MLKFSLQINALEIVRLENESDVAELLKIIDDERFSVNFKGSGVYGYNSHNVYEILSNVETNNLLSMISHNLVDLFHCSIEIKNAIHS